MDNEAAKLKHFALTAEQRHALTELCDKAGKDLCKAGASATALRDFLQQIDAENTTPITDEPFILPPDLAQMVLIETTPTELILRPKSFLGTGTFHTLLALTKRFNGRYVSLGKNSHFIVPKPKAKQP